MLKNVYDFKGKRKYQDGIVQLYDKIWIYGYNLKDPEIKYLIDKFKVKRKYLENLNQYLQPKVLAKSPHTFVFHDFLVDKKVVQNNILFVIGDNYVKLLGFQYAPGLRYRIRDPAIIRQLLPADESFKGHSVKLIVFDQQYIVVIFFHRLIRQCSVFRRPIGEASAPAGDGQQTLIIQHA